MKTDIEIVNKTIEYIELHLNEKLSLESASNAVHYSKYHLHRIFTNAVGLTIHDYLQRRQLTEAAKLLVFSDKSIVDIAIISGYESQQAFTNVFKQMYKLSPKKYREREQFYPLQLRFKFNENENIISNQQMQQLNLDYATDRDIDEWMNLVYLVVDGLPYFSEKEYIEILKKSIKNKQALVLKDKLSIIGIMIVSYDTGSIDFMGIHPLYRQNKIPKFFLDKVINELLNEKNVSITTYRKGDKADTGYREEIINLGFAEAELLVEFGYPTQRFIFSKEKKDGKQK